MQVSRQYRLIVGDRDQVGARQAQRSRGSARAGAELGFEPLPVSAEHAWAVRGCHRTTATPSTASWSPRPRLSGSPSSQPIPCSASTASKSSGSRVCSSPGSSFRSSCGYLRRARAARRRHQRAAAARRAGRARGLRRIVLVTQLATLAGAGIAARRDTGDPPRRGRPRLLAALALRPSRPVAGSRRPRRLRALRRPVVLSGEPDLRQPTASPRPRVGWRSPTATKRRRRFPSLSRSSSSAARPPGTSSPTCAVRRAPRLSPWQIAVAVDFDPSGVGVKSPQRRWNPARGRFSPSPPPPRC